VTSRSGRAVTVVVPGSIQTRTGGSIYDRRIADGLRAGGWDVTIVELDPVAHPLRPPLDRAAAQFAAIPDHSRVLIDGLAFGTMPEMAERHGCRLRFVPIVHMALSATPGLLPGELGWLSNLERRALDHARQVVVTGSRTVPLIASMSGRLTAEHVTVIPPGTDRVMPPRAPGGSSRGIRLLCVANVTAGKGHDILLRALAARMKPGATSDSLNGEWALVCAGSLTRDLAHAARCSALARDLGIDDRVSLPGELDDEDLAAEYARADVFVLATRGETYGMAVAEAIAHGLPVVSTRTGEIETIVGEGGLLAAAGDEVGFATQLASVMGSRDVLERLSHGARAAARQLPTWEESVTQMAAVLDNVEQ
jgi:glycosyltransferase involved in cell wall biosynthesis